MTYQATRAFAQSCDAADPLASYRDQFHFPQTENGEPTHYFLGNSLGLQPKATEAHVRQILEDWRTLGVRGHFAAPNPWMTYHEQLAARSAPHLGARPSEVTLMNGLTVNLHLLLVSFYRPTPKRYKILMEAKAFPSDIYAIKSHLRFHGFDPAEALIEAKPRAGESTIRTEDLIGLIEEEGASIALVMLAGVNYYTGQAFEMGRITEAGHAQGCTVGFDLAHAAGNIELRLHDWDVDFAAWCTYKYFNGGPGSLAGAFVHERFSYAPDLDRFTGWWGYDRPRRFEMNPDFDPMRGAEGWQISNQPMLTLAGLHASLDLFAEVGMERLITKRDHLTGYLAFLLDEMAPEGVSIITPRDPAHRGAQLSLRIAAGGKALFQRLTADRIRCDWREPDVIRVAPVPFYNSYEDAFVFAETLTNLCRAVAQEA